MLSESFLCALGVCTLGFWAPKPWNMALNKGICDPKPKVTNIKDTNLKSLMLDCQAIAAARQPPCIRPHLANRLLKVPRNINPKP